MENEKMFETKNVVESDGDKIMEVIFSKAATSNNKQLKEA
jgi:hypothetical protein